jgi:hypothetical protein
LICFPKLSGDNALPGVETMGFDFVMGKRRRVPRGNARPIGVSYSGQDMDRAFDFTLRAMEEGE